MSSYLSFILRDSARAFWSAFLEAPRQMLLPWRAGYSLAWKTFQPHVSPDEAVSSDISEDLAADPHEAAVLLGWHEPEEAVTVAREILAENLEEGAAETVE